VGLEKPLGMTVRRRKPSRRVGLCSRASDLASTTIWAKATVQKQKPDGAALREYIVRAAVATWPHYATCRSRLAEQLGVRKDVGSSTTRPVRCATCAGVTCYTSSASRDGTAGGPVSGCRPRPRSMKVRGPLASALARDVPANTVRAPSPAGAVHGPPVPGYWTRRGVPDDSR